MRLFKELILIFIFFLIAGCQTLKGVKESVEGLGEDIYTTSKNVWQTIKKADSWFRENYW